MAENKHSGHVNTERIPNPDTQTQNKLSSHKTSSTVMHKNKTSQDFFSNEVEH